MVWNSHGLLIEADNSSLKQILKDVSAATGARVEGLSTDERIFGNYGPGQVRDVLSQLLEGSGYNVMMIGGQDRAAPLRVVLSLRPKGNPPTAPNNQAASENEDEIEPEEPPQPPVPQPAVIRNGFGPGLPSHSPQQIMEQMRRRQQELEQRQEQVREREEQQN